MLHICCIRAGEAFSPDYVLILKDMITRNVDDGFRARFVCFTDRPQDMPAHIETAPLPAELPGWWSKLALFREGLFPAGDRVLFFDLDTVITGPIDELVAYQGEFGILQDFYRPLGLQSSIMAWEAGKHSDIWETFARAGCPMDDPGGDQAWIEKCYSKGRERLQVAFPGMFVSYKQTRGIPSDASVVVFHGHPRPHEVTEGWVPRTWKVGGLSSSALKAVCNTELEERFGNVRSACARDLPWFDPVNEEHDRHVAIIGGGPSVVDYLDEIRWRKSIGQEIWVLNNAHRALGDIAPDKQIVLDARPETAAFLIDDAGEFLVASQCHPSVFDALAFDAVTLWHVNTPGMEDLLEDEKARVTCLIGGGTTVGMNAIALACLRGYRKIHLYGFDSSFRDDAHHAYPQALNDADPKNDVLYGDKSYVCAPWMVGQAQEFMEMAPRYEADGCIITVHGTGLLPDIARDLATVMSPAELRAHEVLSRCPDAKWGVEIGVFAGEMSRALLKASPELNLIMVDSWEGDGRAYEVESGDWHATLGQQSQDEFMRQAKKRVEFAGSRARVVCSRSVAAAERVNPTMDFVFIDADHSYEGCAADIEAWFPKLKPDGLLCGHDYQNPDFPQFGVTRAVDEFVSRHGLVLEVGQNFCWFVKIPRDAAAAA